MARLCYFMDKCIYGISVSHTRFYQLVIFAKRIIVRETNYRFWKQGEKCNVKIN